MKRIINILAMVCLTISMLCGCGTAPVSQSQNKQSEEESEEFTEGTESEETEAGESEAETSDSEYVNADGSFKNGSPYTAEEALKLRFRKKSNLDQHYEKHGIEMGFEDEIAYRDAAAAVVANPKALHKLEAEDQDDVYYIEETNEFVVVSKDGYLRTYFNPSAGIKYYNKQ